jgi:hypothetical protein
MTIFNRSDMCVGTSDSKFLLAFLLFENQVGDTVNQLTDEMVLLQKKLRNGDPLDLQQIFRANNQLKSRDINCRVRLLKKVEVHDQPNQPPAACAL